ncbi:MAG: adenylate/guanylate cyclase domain-containing protein [Myxococcales bacterium]|nr:adenylate/guanylate cyclase domain-containing protein [Myxococcales bacterium]
MATSALAPAAAGTSFDEYRRLLTVRFTAMIAWFLLIITPLLWPTDKLFFGDDAGMLAFFDYWRPRIIALTVLTIVGLRLVERLRRRPAIVATVMLTAGAALCGAAVGGLGERGEVYYAYGFLLSLATIPLIVSPPARLAINLIVPLAFTIPYYLTHPAYFEGAAPFAYSTMIFQVFAMAASVLVGHVLFALIRDNFNQRQILGRQARELADAREKSERLLLNILPQTVASQLKDGALVIADAYDDVSVLFVDICGFTGLSEGAEPGEVVALLNLVFSAYDGLVERYGVEKIKTIGDAYMVAAGLPRKRPDHAEAIAGLALEMRDVAATFVDPSGAPLRVRIGASCGPVVAGVIGRKKFIYDLWGDTVNTAARMESHGAGGRIQVTEAAKVRLDGRFVIRARGVVDIKGKGPMPVYWLEGERAEEPAGRG